MTSSCSVYDGSLAQTSGGGMPSSGAGGDTGMAGSDIGTSAGGTSAGATGEISGSAGGEGNLEGGSTGGASGSSGTLTAGGSVAPDANGAGGSGRSTGGGAVAGGNSGNGTGGVGGSSNGANDAGPRDAAGDVSVQGDGGVVCAPGACKRVFVTASSPVLMGNLGGVGPMDAYCQSRADANRLGGTWKVWLSESDPMTSPSVRFTHATVPYLLLDGTVIANSWTALTSGTLAHPINVSEDGVPLEAGNVLEVWTGTTITGTYSGNACANWTNATANLPNADIGLSNQTGAGWTKMYLQFCNRTNLRVYCFEQ